MKVFLYILLVSLFSSKAFSFNWEKCSRFFDRAHPVTSIFYVMSSSSQFSISTGDCAMIGMAAHDRKVFLSYNLENIQTDSARGYGEYITAYALLSGCNEAGRKALPTHFQKNFIQIFGEGVEKKPKAIYESMEYLIQTNPMTSKHCKLKT